MSEESIGDGQPLPVTPKAKIHFTGWINRADGTREMITGESDEVDEQACIDAGIPKREEKTDGTNS
jgi:hypothetical protein